MFANSSMKLKNIGGQLDALIWVDVIFVCIVISKDFIGWNNGGFSKRIRIQRIARFIFYINLG